MGWPLFQFERKLIFDFKTCFWLRFLWRAKSFRKWKKSKSLHWKVLLELRALWRLCSFDSKFKQIHIRDKLRWPWARRRWGNHNWRVKWILTDYISRGGWSKYWCYFKSQNFLNNNDLWSFWRWVNLKISAQKDREFLWLIRRN